MEKTRTTVMLDEDLLSRTKKLIKADSTSHLIEHLMKEAIRRDSLEKLASALGSKDPADQGTETPPRRRHSV